MKKLPLQIFQQLRRHLLRSPLHRLFLEFTALVQWAHYRITGLRTPEARHQPKIFCVGNFKTGTVSLTNILGQQIHGRHEPHGFLYSKMWLRFQQGRISEAQWDAFLIRRSNALKLDFEASGFLATEAPRLARLFPQTKFILTIREPESWCRSMLKHVLKNRKKLGCHYWEPVLAEWFGEDFANEEKPLKERKLYPLNGMLAYWRQSYQQAIDAIPLEKRLVVETEKLSESSEQLEAFLGYAPDAFYSEQTHFHKGSETEDPLRDISPGYIQTVFTPFCHN